MKFYGLPLEREEDRHKWFFSSSEAVKYIKYRTEKNNYELYDTYIDLEGYDGIPAHVNWFKKLQIKWARKILFRPDFPFTDLYEGTQWYVLKRRDVT